MNALARFDLIYRTNGDIGALLAGVYLYNLQGEWIGFVTPEQKVYSVHGQYAGEMAPERRIVRKREYDYRQPAQPPPPPPGRIRPPAHLPLAPLLPELPFNQIDVLESEPDRLPTLDFGEYRRDME